MRLLEVVSVELAGAISREVGIIPTTWLVCNWHLFALRTREGGFRFGCLPIQSEYICYSSEQSTFPVFVSVGFILVVLTIVTFD